MRSLWIRTIVAALAIAATLGLAALPAAQAETTNVPGALIGGTNHSCFFYYGAVGPSVNAAGEKSANIAYPDAGAYYWGAYLRVPAGSTLKLHGQFPYSRYMSLVGYNAAGNTVDGLYDEMINPDPGSQNPFRPGVPRNTPNRNYTVEVINKALPAELTNEKGEKYKTSKALHFAEESARPNNELYDGAPAANKEKLVNQETKAQTAEYETELVVLRVYVPNKGHEPAGRRRAARTGTEAVRRRRRRHAHGFCCVQQDGLGIDSAQSGTGSQQRSSQRPAPRTAVAAAEQERLARPEQTVGAGRTVQRRGYRCRNQSSRRNLPETEIASRGSGTRADSTGCRKPGGIPGHGNGKLAWPVHAEVPAAGLDRRRRRDRSGNQPAEGRRRRISSRTSTTTTSATCSAGRSARSWLRKASSRPRRKRTKTKREHCLRPARYQDRYTSFCMNQSPRSTMVMACVYDEQIPVNAQP